MMVDALVSFGYPFDRLCKMNFSQLQAWLDVATKRARHAE